MNAYLVVLARFIASRPGELMPAGGKESVNQVSAHVRYDGPIPCLAHVTEVAPPTGSIFSTDGWVGKRRRYF
jgi:hypothetical protein